MCHLFITYYQYRRNISSRFALELLENLEMFLQYHMHSGMENMFKYFTTKQYVTCHEWSMILQGLLHCRPCLMTVLYLHYNITSILFLSLLLSLPDSRLSLEYDRLLLSPSLSDIFLSRLKSSRLLVVVTS